MLIGALLYPERNYWRPKTRADCANVQRPCGFLSCRMNNFLDRTPNGSLQLNFPELQPWDMNPDRSCALDMANEPHTLEEVGDAINVTRERARQIETQALANLARAILDPR